MIKNTSPLLKIASRIAIFVIIFALMDYYFWGSLEERFGLTNEWYLIGINFHTTFQGIDHSYLYPNAAFLLFLTAVITLTIVYYLKLNKKTVALL